MCLKHHYNDWKRRENCSVDPKRFRSLSFSNDGFQIKYSMVNKCRSGVLTFGF